MADSQQRLLLTSDNGSNRLFRVGAIQYVVLGELEDVVVPLQGTQEFLTVLPSDPNDPWTREKLTESLVDLDIRDDVSCAAFTKWLLFCGTARGNIDLSQDVLTFLDHRQIQHTIAEIGHPSQHESWRGKAFAIRPLAPGPYLRHGNGIRPIRRLYDDRNVTLMDSLAPSRTERPYSSLHVLSGDHTVRSIAVPSRQRTKANHKRQNSISGKRVIVKDIFDITGLRKTACNKAYYDVASIATETAPMIQRLIDAGASIVGLARLSSMVSREEPSESFDYQVPFNPRGDGYQSPAGSSSGSAAAIAAYDWLDFAIGTDSTGSARRPAMANGIFSIRISSGMLPHEGMVPCFPLFDTPAVFTRDLNGLGGFVHEWCSPKMPSAIKTPTTILMPTDYFPVTNSAQQSIIDIFTRDLSACFGISIRHICLRELWKHSPPLEAIGQPLEVYLQDVATNSFFYDFFHSSDTFRAMYVRKHHRQPAVNRVTKWRWEVARGISQSQRDEAVRRLDVYKKWLLERVLVGENPIVLLPVMEARPTYRDTPPGEAAPATQDAWDQLWMSPILGAPEITVPIGHIPYLSRVSEVEEMLPVAISLMGLPGTDVSLINTAKTVLAKSGRHLQVAAGKDMFVEGWEMVERTQSL